MIRKLRRLFRGRRYSDRAIDPDEIFLDSSNLPDFDVHQFEGRLERPIPRRSLAMLGAAFLLILAAFSARLWFLQVRDGYAYAQKSENNRLKHTLIFAERGRIIDRNGTALAWNDLNPGSEFSQRRYTPLPGFAHVLGYVNYPKKDKYGFYYDENFNGVDGVEEMMNGALRGQNGLQILETDALGNVQSQSVTEPPKHGQDVRLTIDARVQHRLYEAIEGMVRDYGFQGGAGVIIDVRTGEVLALTSYPEYSPEVMANGDAETKKKQMRAPNNPFLDRVVTGLYTPGSIVKPYMAVAALTEDVISPEKKILSTGSLRLANPYSPGQYSVFGDWKAHGWVNMRQAIAASSDVYFYVIGGGFGDQKGIGIANIDKYMRLFGFGSKTGTAIPGEKEGTIPTPEWKERKFGEPWRIGDTYNTSIGQYGFQVTPLQAARAVGALATGGLLVTPTLFPDDAAALSSAKRVELDQAAVQVAREGMRMCVTDLTHGTCKITNSPDVQVAAKTGTAELGITKALVNSWATGFFPYDDPRYAFAIVMEKGSRDNLVGATFAFRQLVDWMAQNTPEHLKAERQAPSRPRSKAATDEAPAAD